MLGKARPGLTLYLREGLFSSLSVLIIGPLFSPTRAHNPWSTAEFDSGHIDDTMMTGCHSCTQRTI